MGQVNLSDSTVDSLVAKITEAVTRQQQVELLEQFKQYARTESDLARLREDFARLQRDADDAVARKDAEIASLNARLQDLSRVLATPQAFQVPIATTYPVPTFGQHYAATNPVPQQFAPPAAAWQPAPVADPATSPASAPPATVGS